jgi:hypothetical protein
MLHQVHPKAKAKYFTGIYLSSKRIFHSSLFIDSEVRFIHNRIQGRPKTIVQYGHAYYPSNDYIYETDQIQT